MPEASVATKPISRIRALAPHLERVLEDPAAALQLAVVGGAVGVEVSLNVTGRFQAAGRLADLDLTIVEQEDPILPGFPEGMRRYAARLLRRRGANIRTATTVTSVTAPEEKGPRVGTATDRGGVATLRPDVLLWTTGAVGPPWLRESGLSTDERGFLRVTRRLQTPTHPRIFAAGDCATIPDLSLAKVGVHAVKQGPLPQPSWC